MLWLELTKNPPHGGAGWEFGKCLWSPNAKDDGSNWPFWSALLSVKKGDSIGHLKHNGKGWDFVGTSEAASDGFTTNERPPQPEDSGFAKAFNRVDLENFQAFTKPIPLKTVFQERDVELRTYFLSNKEKPKSKRKHIFYVIQLNRLQCLNGAYLSEVDDELAGLLFGLDYSANSKDKKISVVDIPTGEILRTLKARVGQAEFSAEVRDNYSHKCCFPDYSVDDGKFLIGAHIARWADALELRGKSSNGLCLCLMHDKAFEKGLFTLNNDYKVIIPKMAAARSNWASVHLVPHAGKIIKLGALPPSKDSLERHRSRHGILI